MSISTVSQQFHADIVDIDRVSKPGSMQNIVVDIDGFTAVSRRYHRYRQGFKVGFDVKNWCRYRRFHSSFTSISSISTGVQSLVPCKILLSISTVSQQFHVDIDDYKRLGHE